MIGEFNSRKIHFIASEFHFFTHLHPIWEALDPEIRGFFYYKKGMGRNINIPYCYKKPFKTKRELLEKINLNLLDFFLSASYGNVSLLKQEPIPMILTEHGIGQTYSSPHSSFANSRIGKDNVFLFLSPNLINKQKYLEKDDNRPIEVIGVPKMDKWHNQDLKKREKKPIVCLSFHWDSYIVPETRGTFSFYQPILEALNQNDHFSLVTHGHPRIINKVKRYSQDLGIETYDSFEEVLEKADIYACDNSSTLFEFASTNRPVVVLNAPWYRRNINHGLRFWDFSDIGYNCNKPEELEEVILKSLNEDQETRERREEIISILFPYRGVAANRAAQVLEDFVKRFSLSNKELKKLLEENVYKAKHSINSNYLFKK